MILKNVENVKIESSNVLISKITTSLNYKITTSLNYNFIKF